MKTQTLKEAAAEFCDAHCYSRDCMADERKVALHAFEAGARYMAERAAGLFNRWDPAHHDQTYRGGSDDECMLSFRVMDIISDNILALLNEEEKAK